MNAVKSGTTTTTTTTSKPPPIVILGDVKMKEIPEMLLNKAMMNPGFGGLAYFLESFKGAFGVAPTASVVTMTLACTLVDNNFIELFVLLYGVSVVSDVLLKDRDVILAENVIKGVDIAKRLRKKELLSKQFTFSSSSSSLTNNDDDDDVCDEKEEEDAALPVFTLKRPFENKDEIRRLNLFEPRWLAMLDEIANRNDGSLVGAKLGVVLAQNRLYTPANFDKIEQQKRVASIVFDPFVQRAKVVDAKESTRPVTGARKVEVFIALDSETNDDFIGDFREAPGQRGYMLASKKLEKKTTTTTTTTTTTSKESTIGRRRENDDDAKKKKTTTTKPPPPIACVVVCGKLHVRGVVGRLSRETSFFDDSRQSRQSQSEKSGRSSRSSIKVM